MKIEDELIRAINESTPEYNEDGECVKCAEVGRGDVVATAYATYAYYKDEDYQTFDWGSSLVNIEYVVDGLISLDVECYDNEKQTYIDLDVDYIRKAI